MMRECVLPPPKKEYRNYRHSLAFLKGSRDVVDELNHGIGEIRSREELLWVSVYRPSFLEVKRH
jgi:hypothetical protein